MRLGLGFFNAYIWALNGFSKVENPATNLLFRFPEANLTYPLKETECFRHWFGLLFKYPNLFCKSSLSSPKVVQYIIDLYKNTLSHT